MAYGTKQIECPNCGREIPNSHQVLSDVKDGEKKSITCPFCTQVFNASKHTIFSSRIK